MYGLVYNTANHAQVVVNTRVFELSCLLVVTVNKLDSFARKGALLTFVAAAYMRDMAGGTTDKRANLLWSDGVMFREEYAGACNEFVEGKSLGVHKREGILAPATIRAVMGVA